MESNGKKKLQESKMRMTVQRKVIHDELCSMSSHPTADEIYRSVKKKIPKISLGTVYRNLDILAQSGVIRKLELGSNQRRYDGTLSPHYHVRCLDCERVDDVSASAIDISKAVEHKGGYDIYGHDLEFFGMCPDCKAKRKDEDSELD